MYLNRDGETLEKDEAENAEAAKGPQLLKNRITLVHVH
jgi:hypothetical protein